MFVLAQTQSFTYPVTVEVISNGGAVKRDKFTATFKRLDTTQVTNWMTRITEASREGAEAQTQLSRELAQDVVIDWSDVVDANGTPIPFSADMLSAALDIHPTPVAIASAWVEAINGGAKRKN
jgi:hypothetical protein